MIINRRKLMYGAGLGTRFTLYLMGDWHLGNRMVDLRLLKSDLQELKDDPNALVLLMGDLGEFITPKDKRWDSETVDESIIPMSKLDQMHIQILEYAEGLLTEIGSKIIGIHGGNHGLRDKSSGMMTRYEALLAKMLNVPYLGYSSFTDLCFERVGGGARRTITIHGHHGWQGSRRPGSLVNQLQLEKAVFPTADIIARGHSHHLGAWRFRAVVPSHNNREPREKDWVGVCTGSYLRGLGNVETYSERAGLAPTPTGCPRVQILLTDESFRLRVTE